MVETLRIIFFIILCLCYFKQVLKLLNYNILGLCHFLLNLNYLNIKIKNFKKNYSQARAIRVESFQRTRLFLRLGPFISITPRAQPGPLPSLWVAYSNLS